MADRFSSALYTRTRREWPNECGLRRLCASQLIFAIAAFCTESPCCQDWVLLNLRYESGSQSSKCSRRRIGWTEPELDALPRRSARTHPEGPMRPLPCGRGCICWFTPSDMTSQMMTGMGHTWTTKGFCLLAKVRKILRMSGEIHTFEKHVPTLHLGKWNQRLKHAICPSCLFWSHAQMAALLISALQKKGYPYSNLSTGGPTCYATDSQEPIAFAENLPCQSICEGLQARCCCGTCMKIGK